MSNTPRKPQAKARAIDPVEHIDWLALWAISLGICAVVLAAIAYFTVGDKLGAATIMASVAGIIGAVLHVSGPPAQHTNGRDGATPRDCDRA